MKTNWFKRTLCSILAFVMVLGYVPATAFASEADGLCEHHTQHTTECGYSAAVAGHDCGHEHTDECYQLVTECVHSHGDCGYVAAVEGHSCDCQPAENGEIIHTEGCGYVEAVAEVLCGHVCSEETGCVTKMLNCQHQHDDTCGYAEAAAETPCGFVCEDCTKRATEQSLTEKYISREIVTRAFYKQSDNATHEAQAAAIPSINDQEVFIKQATSKTCTLASSVMMLRRRAILENNANWSAITESAVKAVAWGNGGLAFTFKYSGMTVDTLGLASSGYITVNQKKQFLIDWVSSNSEGIVIYNHSRPHAILLTDYDMNDDCFYCADPSSSAGKGRIPLTSCTIPGNTQDEIIGNINQIWRITSSDGTVGGDTPGHTHSFVVEFEALHPHNEYKKCTGCGLIEYTGCTTKVDNCAQCLSVSVPAAPNNFSVVYIDNERANLSWLPSVGATSYEAQYWSPGSNTWKTDTSYSNGTSYVSSGLKNYDSWKFRVRAKNSAGVSDWTTCAYNKADYSTITGYCGVNGTNLSYAISNDGILTIYGSGSMAGYTDVSPDGTMGTPAPWYNDRYKIKTVVIQPGVTSIGTWAFYGCTNMTAISIPETVTDINDAAFFSCISLRSIRLPSSISRTENLIFAYCTGLSSVILPANLKSIGDNTFMACQSLASITIPNSVRSIGTSAFQGTGLKDVYYNCTKMHWKTITIGNYNSPLQNANMHYDSWASAVRSVFIACPVDVEILDTEDRIVHVLEDGKEWSTHTDYGHFAVYTDDNDESVKYFDIVEGYSFRIRGTDFGSMTVSYSENEGEILTVSNIPVVPSMVATIDGGDVPILMIDKDADGTSEESIPMDTGIPSSPDNVKLHADELGLKVSDEVWVDGEKCIVQSDNDGLYVALPDANARTMVTYSYNNPNAADVHTKYPIGMKVWKLKQENGVYTATYVPELDNLLQYSGSSIRITGNKGIRMITSVNQDTRNALIGNGLAGYKLLEYGTLLAQTSKLGNNPLVLGGANVKSNYAYKKGVADPVFKYTNGLIQYTNVLIGFTDEQCKEDIAMRPYMKLLDENGEEFVIYGGIVYRSIGYIAYQNRNAFQPRSAAYEYVWSIIHNVYGNQYDSEYKK